MEEPAEEHYGFRYDTPESVREYVARNVGEGWVDLVVALMYALHSLDPSFTIQQVKEKFGGLRFYASTSETCRNGDLFFRLIDKAESLSYTLCERCGSPGNPCSIRGWARTLCDAHATELAKGDTIFWNDTSYMEVGEYSIEKVRGLYRIVEWISNEEPTRILFEHKELEQVIQKLVDMKQTHQESPDSDQRSNDADRQT